MKILIIGNGFIATAIIQRLQNEGHDLLVYSRTSKRNIQCKQVIGDIFEFNNFTEVLSWSPQVIIHTAWVTSHDAYKEDPTNFQYAQFTIDLGRYVSHSDVEHLVVLGTCAEYGFQKGPSSAGVTTVNPNNLYGKQKVFALNSIREFFQDSAVRLSWARIFYPYGPNQDTKRLLPYLIDSLKNGYPIELSDTSSVFDWISTRDVASAISWVIKHETPTEIDVGTGMGFTNVELLGHLEELLGISKQSRMFTTKSDSSRFVSLAGGDSPLFKSGWVPGDSLVSGLEWILSS